MGSLQSRSALMFEPISRQSKRAPLAAFQRARPAPPEEWQSPSEGRGKSSGAPKPARNLPKVPAPSRIALGWLPSKAT